MKLPPFMYHQSSSTEHALELLAQHGPDSKLLAGGQSLLPLMALRMAAPSSLIDVAALDELRYIRRDGGALIIGATTRHAALEAEPHPRPWQAFADALPLLGHLPIRTRGTIGGSLAHADATAELPLLAQTFEATIAISSRSARRELPAAAFFRGVLTTALEPDEMICEVRFPAPPPAAASAFEEFSERAGDFALASACVAVAADADGICSWCRIGLGAVAATPVRALAAERSLVGRRLSDQAIREASAAVLEDCEPRAGLHCSAEFRGELIVAMTERAALRAARRALREASA